MASLRKRAATGNRARDDKWAAVMANKTKMAEADTLESKAKMKEVNQRAGLQASNNRAMMARQGMVGRQALQQAGARGVNQRSNTRLQGQNQQANVSATGAQNRETLGQKNAYDVERRGVDRTNALEDQSSTRGFKAYMETGDAAVAGAVQGGVNGQVPYAKTGNFDPKGSYSMGRTGTNEDGVGTYGTYSTRSGETYKQRVERMKKKKAADMAKGQY